MLKLSKDLNLDLDRNLKIQHEKIKVSLGVYCCLCVKNKKEFNNQPNDISHIKFYDFKLENVVQNPEYKFYGNHLACLPCLEKLDKKKLGLDERMTSINDIKKDLRISCFCNICNMEHDTILKAGKGKKAPGACTGCECTIF